MVVAKDRAGMKLSARERTLHFFHGDVINKVTLYGGDLIIEIFRTMDPKEAYPPLEGVQLRILELGIEVLVLWRVKIVVFGFLHPSYFEREDVRNRALLGAGNM